MKKCFLVVCFVSMLHSLSYGSVFYTNNTDTVKIVRIHQFEVQQVFYWYQGFTSDDSGWQSLGLLHVDAGYDIYYVDPGAGLFFADDIQPLDEPLGPSSKPLDYVPVGTEYEEDSVVDVVDDLNPPPTPEPTTNIPIANDPSICCPDTTLIIQVAGANTSIYSTTEDPGYQPTDGITITLGQSLNLTAVGKADGFLKSVSWYYFYNGDYQSDQSGYAVCQNAGAAICKTGMVMNTFTPKAAGVYTFISGAEGLARSMDGFPITVTVVSP